LWWGGDDDDDDDADDHDRGGGGGGDDHDHDDDDDGLRTSKKYKDQKFNAEKKKTAHHKSTYECSMHACMSIYAHDK
jgi:hypothetical protein